MRVNELLARSLIGALAFVLMAGAAWAAYCTNCGKDLPESARFCPQCGARVLAPAPAPAAVPPADPSPQKAAALREDSPDDEPLYDTSAHGLKPAHAAENGTLKVGSTPMDCVVTFRGNGYEKARAVLVFPDVPPGRYTVSFSREDRRTEKVVEIHPGQTTFVFGSLRRDASAVKLSGGEKKPAAPPVVPAPSSEKKKLVPQASFQGESIRDADDKYRLAEALRKSPNVFAKRKRYEEAKRMYEEVLERWPRSDKVVLCHYELGQIYESVYWRDHRKAIDKYKDVLRLDFQSGLDVRWRIAVLYDNRLGEKTTAREWYELAAKYAKSETTRKRAAQSAEILRKQGF